MLREARAPLEERLEKTQSVTVKVPSFSAQMQEARIRRRMTIDDLAKACDVDSRTVSMYENGSEMPTASIRDMLIKVLEMN